MSNQIRLDNLSALADMRTALKRFGVNMISTLDQIEMRLRRNEESLKDKLNVDKSAVERCTRELEHARDALCDRENSDDEDDGESPDCSYEQDAVYQAQADLESLEQQLAFTRQVCGRATKQFQEYRLLAGRTKKMMNTEVAQAQALLHTKVTSIENYKNVVAESASEFSDISSTATYVPSAPAVVTSSNTGHWVEMGIVNFNLNGIQNVEGISSGADFKKVSKDEMEAGLNKYTEMKGLIDSGEGDNRDYWTAVDKKLGLTYAEGYQRIYEAFYGSEPIRVTKDGESYTIENGRHRIWLAKQMGITSLPASVVEKKD